MTLLAHAADLEKLANEMDRAQHRLRDEAGRLYDMGCAEEIAWPGVNYAVTDDELYAFVEAVESAAEGMAKRLETHGLDEHLPWEAIRPRRAAFARIGDVLRKAEGAMNVSNERLRPARD